MEEIMGEILVVPFFGQGHVFPLTEFCKKLSSFRFKTTLIISSDISSSLLRHPFVNVAAVDAPLPPPPKPGKFDPQPLMLHFNQMRQGMETMLTTRVKNKFATSVVCAIVDTMMLSHIEDIFTRFQVPIVGFFTCGAACLAMDYAAWKADVECIKPGETRFLPELPNEMAMDYVDIVRRSFGSEISRTKKKSFPTQPGDEPPWVEEVKVTVAILVNTFVELEQPFLEYLAKQTGLPIWGVGPMLPEKFWTLTASRSLLRDRDIKTNSSEKTNYSEDEVLNWLDSKSPSSIIYISFGTDVVPTLEEHEEIAKALEESSRQNFIWVISKNQDYYPNGLETQVGKRGLIINGWAPQLLILSHSSTGGFLTHCGWSSTMEAIGQGVPLLAWPIRGDQFYNAKLIVCYLKTGHMVSSIRENIGLKRVKKEEIIQGVQRLMEDKQVHNRVKDLSDKFRNGFPISSAASLHDFKDFIMQAK
ncbi:PREDICTED: scopoletin glucosyltransferase-like [Nicotiana attenuata]|uniref:Glycosyltransferase n=1 Tax=Nicotiana attenuata TaxID=49451 RepID=A0A1J6JWL5_NICAT|nr:PREDICTED: scopoletin glucosyltransferase-like [Nicotiana attenuata]AQQ16716.1 UDP-glycosyltransferase g36713 [Nicotiana attenuata]OIT20852.1 scopoletin glucosyltransferase [Nicotiana attenuata]